jgi:hypothetical protein
LLAIFICVLVPALTWAVAPAAGSTAGTQAGRSGTARTPEVTATLDHSSYEPGSALRLTVTENLPTKFTLEVVDSSGTAWKLLSQDDGTAVFGAEAGHDGGAVAVTLTRSWDRAVAQAKASYAVQAASKWPGHVPGKFYLGMSCGTICPEREGELGHSYGVIRQFKNWGDLDGVAKSIQDAHAANKLPWISIKPPQLGADGWRAIAEGRADADIIALADTLKANDDKPTLITFHHEPSNDGSEAEGALWAAAYAHFHDVLQAQGALRNVADPPILGDWLFNPSNRTQDPANWVTDAVLSRAPFLGIDLYENNSGETFATRIPRVLDYAASHGYPDMMVGIGETGGTDATYGKTSAVEWLNESLTWAAANTDKVGVVSYFNSTANSREGVYWPLDESDAKLSAYRGWLDHPAAVH